MAEYEIPPHGKKPLEILLLESREKEKGY